MNVLNVKKSRIIIGPKESLKTDTQDSERRDTLVDPDLFSQLDLKIQQKLSSKQVDKVRQPPQRRLQSSKTVLKTLDLFGLKGS